MYEAVKGNRFKIINYELGKVHTVINKNKTKIMVTNAIPRKIVNIKINFVLN